MNQEKIKKISRAIADIVEATDIPKEEVIESLIGCAISEEEATKVEKYLVRYYPNL